MQRGYSFAGWGLNVARTERQAWLDWAEYATPDELYSERYDGEDAALDSLIERFEDEGLHVEPCDDGFLVALPGLSAFFGSDDEDAIDQARADGRFDVDQPLYVFEAEYIADDQDANVSTASHVAVVRPLSTPVLVA